MSQTHTINLGECWLYTGHKARHGYGIIVGKELAHRTMYENMVGQIPRGLHIDHLCRVRCCINPEHLEPVTSKINVLRGVGWGAVNARKTSCINGHAFVGTTVYRRPDGKGRECKPCRAATEKRRRTRLKLKERVY